MRRPSGLTATELTACLVPGEPVDAGAGRRGPRPRRCGRRTRRRCVVRRGSPPRISPHSWCPVSRWMSVPDSRSQTATVWSLDPETMRRPSGLTATEFTQSWCPGAGGCSVPDSRSQTATVWSSDPETMRRPSGLTATERHPILVPGELADAGAGLEVPDRHGVVVGPRDDAPSVGAHRHGIHRILVPGELVDAGAGLEVPDRHGLVVRTRRRCDGRRGSPPRTSPNRW